MWGLVVILALMIPLVAVLLDSQLGRALANRLEPGRQGAADDAANKRIAHLEAEIERLNSEVLRLDEETTFLHRLLESKPASRGELPPSGEQN